MLVVALVTTAAGCGGLYLRIPTGEATTALWRGVIDKEIENLDKDANSIPNQTAQMERHPAEQHKRRWDEFGKHFSTLNSRINALPDTLNDIRLPMAWSGTNGGASQ